MEKKINQYITGELSKIEKAAFEKEMGSDPALQKKVAEHRFALKAIRLEGRARLKNRLSQLDTGNAHFNSIEKKTFLQKNKWILFSALILTVFFSWFILKNNTPTIDSPPIEKIEEKLAPDSPQETPSKKEDDVNEKTKPSPPVETNHPAKQIKPTAEPAIKNRPIATTKPASPDGKALFAQHFEPYHHPSMRPNVRGQNDELSVREKFEKAYWEKDFNQVLQLWSELNDTQKNNGNLFFLKAVALMEQGKIKEAEKDFAALINLKRHRFKQQSEWYLALSKLFNDEKTEAKKILNSVIKNKEHQKNKAALDLIKKIE